jgi:Chaperone of endosialidase
MKSTIKLIFAILFLCTITINLKAQDVTVTLSDTTQAQGFSVLNSESNTLFRVNGNGNVGIGTMNPTGLLEVSSSSLNGRGININAENADGSDSAGSIILNAGTYESFSASGANISMDGGNMAKGGDLYLNSGSSPGSSGNIYIHGSTSGGGSGGSIEIKSGAGAGNAGNITIITQHSNFNSGNISLITAPSNDGGHINIESGVTNNPGADITISAGNSSNGANSINLNAGSSNSDQGGNINLTPGAGGSGSDAGLVVVNGSGTYSGTWTQSSDVRYKKNIRPLQNSLEGIKKLNGVKYEYKTAAFPQKNFEKVEQIGLIAQDVEKIFPELVRTDKDGYKSVAYQNMVAVLIEAVKEQQKQIDELNKKIEILETRATVNTVRVSSLNK